MSQCAELLYRFIWKVCVWTGQSEQSKPLEAGQELKQSVSDRGKNPGKNRAAAVSCMRIQMSFLSIKAYKSALVVTENKIWTPKNEHNMASLSFSNIYGQKHPQSKQYSHKPQV